MADDDFDADLDFLDAAAAKIIATTKPEQHDAETQKATDEIATHVTGQNKPDGEVTGTDNANKKRKAADSGAELQQEEHLIAEPTLNSEYVQQLVTGSVYTTEKQTDDSHKRQRRQGGASAIEIGINHGLDMHHASLIQQQQRTYGYGASTVSKPDENQGSEKKSKKIVRVAGGEKWEDPTLADWPDNDYRIFVGDLGNEVTNEMLLACFREYKSATKARVVINSKSQKVKGYGFVSFLDPLDMGRALREKQGKYCGNRPMKLKKSTWDDRNLANARKREREWKKKHGIR